MMYCNVHSDGEFRPLRVIQKRSFLKKEKKRSLIQFPLKSMGILTLISLVDGLGPRCTSMSNLEGVCLGKTALELS